MRGSSSPIELSMSREGHIVFASTRGAVQAALWEAGLESIWDVTLEEGTYMRFMPGRMTDISKFTPNPGFVYTMGKSSFADQGKAKGKGKTAPKVAPLKVSGVLERYDAETYASLWDDADKLADAEWEEWVEHRAPCKSIHDVPLSVGPYGNDPDLWEWSDDDILHTALTVLNDRMLDERA